jgi:8-hydroxy-5-deazaflavin:NADPH oxidoreductase
MNIGIIGTGFVGGVMGKVWLGKGHDIMFSSRDPESDKVKTLLAEVGGNARAATLEEVVAFADVLALAVPGNTVEEALAPIADYHGKILIDATNRFGASATSSGEDVARYAKNARVVKALNTIGAEQYANPTFEGQAASMFFCGDDAEAKTVVAHLLEDMGFAPIDCGPLSNARLLDSMAQLWVYLMRAGYGREIAFKLLRR